MTQDRSILLHCSSRRWKISSQTQPAFELLTVLTIRQSAEGTMVRFAADRIPAAALRAVENMRRMRTQGLR